MQDTSNEVAIVGIGKMGLPISVLIAKAGYSVTAYDQSAARLVDARAQGIKAASSPTEAASSTAVAS